VTAQLVHGSTDRHLWGESFDVELHDVLDLQREMAAAIVGRVRVELAPTASPAAAERVDPESYQDYLRGRYYWNQRTPEGFQKAIEHFRRAAERDPSYAPAYAGLADCYNLQGVYNLLPPGEAFPRAKAAAQRALALDPELAEAYNSLAWAQFVYDWDWASAERGFEKALALKPGYATAHQQRAVLLAALGRMQEAVQEIDRARELDPLSLSINEVAGWVRYCARQSNAAIDQYRRTLGLDPNFGPARRYLGLVYLEMGEIEQAFAEFEQARAALGDGPELSADLARAYAMAGQEDQARERLEELTATVGRQYVSPFLLASVHAGLGDKDGAFDWLEKAFAARAVNLVFINVDPLFDGLRGDPRFRDLIERIGLPSFPAS
jgi:tetratricopeptide (TPR) repeat protein